MVDGADETPMSDIDAIRCLAEERDLEFVDLDTYGVDPAVGGILSAEISRRHHVVPVKRKFGTPVIATASPDDLEGQDSVRAALGRDFIAVVALPEQISHFLDRFYGDPAEATPAKSQSTGRKSKQAASASPSDALPSPDVDPAADSAQPPAKPEPAPVHRQGSFAAVTKPADPGGDAGPTGRSTDPTQRGRGADPLSELLASPEVLGFEDDLIEEEPGSPAPPTLDLGDVGSADISLTTLVRSLVSDGDGLAGDGLAGEGGPTTATSEATEDAADLVDEAVATFEVQQGRAGGGSTPGAGDALPPLAQALVDDGRVSAADMSDVMAEHARSGQTVVRILTARALVSEADLMWGMAQEMGLEYVDLDLAGVDLTQCGSIPEATARHHNVIVIANRDGTPVVAASNPTDVFAMDDLRTIIGRRFIVVVASRTQISALIDRAFNAGGLAGDVAEEASQGMDAGRLESGPDDLESVTETAPIVRYVNLLILQALNERASDIHIEPTATELRIRYRIDGVLHDVSTAPRKIAGAVTTRLKVMADMNIAEHRVPQDGRFSLAVGAKAIDLRLATLPTIHGEKVVMRVLDKSSVVLGFSDLGFEDDLLGTFEHLYTKPYGTIMVTGPTGSGKSTTLYTTLSALNSPEKNIITVEDPVELPLKGVNQIQVNPKAGLTFATALRSILRSDPDVVLIGEIRDRETASIAVEAALTGHMVLATLHTNSAAATPMRLVEMGIEPYLVTSSLSGVLAQRLARRLCMHCKEPFEPTEGDFLAAGWSLQEIDAMGGIPKVYRTVGCTACAQTGYRGRLALAELLTMTEDVERLIIEGGSVDEIHRLAVGQGMSDLRTNGLHKAMAGETTLEEVLRVVA